MHTRRREAFIRCSLRNACIMHGRQVPNDARAIFEFHGN